jgi:hypothetical protein
VRKDSYDAFAAAQATALVYGPDTESAGWDDIAAAMEELIGSAPAGIKPIFRQAIDEIRELRLDAQREWRPIATAPKEQYVLIWDGKLIEIAFSAERDGNWDTPLPPTHWMPLPDPPAETRQAIKWPITYPWNCHCCKTANDDWSAPCTKCGAKRLRTTEEIMASPRRPE